MHKARERHSSSYSSLGSRRSLSRAGSNRSVNKRGSTPSEDPVLAVMEKVLKDPRDMVSLTNRRSEDFTEPVVSCMALRGGVGGLPIVVCADTSGLCVAYDGATGDLMGKVR